MDRTLRPKISRIPRHKSRGDLRDPRWCSHVAYQWSDAVRLRCGACGIELFLPPRVLRCRSAAEVAAMRAAWEWAGRPHALSAQVGWQLNDLWVVVPHPLFRKLGGLAVLRSILETSGLPAFFDNLS